MIFRFFLLLSTVLFSFSVLSWGTKKLIIIRVKTDNIPEAVKSAVKAIGTVNGRTGFFLDKGVFVTSMMHPIDTTAIHKVTQLGRAKAHEAEAVGHIREGDLVDISGGQAILKRKRSDWGVFEVKSDEEGRLFTREVERPLKISEFRKGDQVFLLSTYSYNDRSNPFYGIYRENLVMRVANSDIQDIEADVDLKKSSPLLDPLRVQLNGSIAVNQRGEVVGFLRLEYGNQRLIKFDSKVITFFSEEAKKIRTDKEMPGEGLQEKLREAGEAMGASFPEKYRGAEGYARFAEEHFGESMREAWEAMGASVPEKYRGAEGYARFVEERSGESMREAALEDTPIGQAVRGAADQGAYAQSVTDIAHGTEETSGAAADTEGNENPTKQSLLGKCRSWFWH